MAIDIKLDTVTKSGNAYTAYVQIVNPVSRMVIETMSLNYDPAKKQAFRDAVRAKAAAHAARVQTTESTMAEIATILDQIKTEIGG